MTEPSHTCCWPVCDEDAVDHLPLCEPHYRKVGVDFISKRTLAGPEFREMDRRADEDRFKKRLAEEIERGRISTERRNAYNAWLAEVSVVYYVRTGRYIKIGFTCDLHRRLSELRLDKTAVLATEPGGRELESQRHAEFAEERIGRREDFGLSLRLQEHIRELQEQAAA